MKLSLNEVYNNTEFEETNIKINFTCHSPISLLLKIKKIFFSYLVKRTYLLNSMSYKREIVLQKSSLN